MKTKVIEVTNGFNWGKFLVGKFDHEWDARSKVDDGPLLRARGWSNEHVFVMDLQTGEGAMFGPWGMASADLNKHQVWVCPMFEPFLEWLYKQAPVILDELPSLAELDPEAMARHSALCGYRRPGPSAEERAQVEKSA